jgi:hypothetical protein
MTTGLLLLALATGALTAGEAASEPSARVEVRFVSATGPVLVVEIENRVRGEELLRQASWAFSARAGVVTASLADAAARGLLREPDRPSSPVGANVEYGTDGGLLISVDRLGPWQEGVELELARDQPDTAPPPVLSAESARLSVDAPERDASGAWTAAATLHGTRGAAVGVAEVRFGPRATGGSLRALDDDALVALSVDTPEVFVADVARTCERDAPSALLLRPEGREPGRLLSSGAGGCLASGAVIVPLTGAWIAKRKERPARGVLVWHPPR